MISKCEDCEYTVTIADLMVTLSELEHFFVQFWINSVEIPVTVFDDADIKFLQESIRVDDGDSIQYILYDMITHIEVKGNVKG